MPVLRLFDFYGYIRLFISTELIIFRTDRTVFIIIISPAFILTATYRFRCFIPRYCPVPGIFLRTCFCFIFGTSSRAFLRAIFGTALRLTLIGCLLCAFLRLFIFFRFGSFRFLFRFSGENAHCIIAVHGKCRHWHTK